jgi:phenylalanyl-tRNA synthetase beta chain
MRISVNWLQEFVEFTATPVALAEMLTMAGFEVEDIEDRRTWADGVVVGKVLNCQPHPNADKLRVCDVDIGATTPAQIVCGAANVGANQFVPVATPGTYLPIKDLKIRPAKLRGVASAGMICSLAELGLAKESDGIHILSHDTNLTSALIVGSDVRPLLGLDDVILDVTSTANRADALSIVGLAREIAAITGATLTLPMPPELPEQLASKGLKLKIAEPQACPRYIGTVIEQVQIAPSPEWLQRRLQSAGIRPINNVVDITNYVLLEWGQPLHAFDRDRCQAVTGESGAKALTIGVRFAESGASLKTLDGQVRTLQSQNLVITANNHPVALAGVMGGEQTEVHSDTQALILEAAIFDSAIIRRSARGQGLRTEASTRYERGVNPAELDLACRRALGLLQEIAGGTIVSYTESGSRKGLAERRSIQLRLERVHQLLGPVVVPDAESEMSVGELPTPEIERILTTLGCTVSPTPQENVWQVGIPPYRERDLEREIDLIEEIARLYGYDNFCDTLPAKTEAGYLSPEQVLNRKVRDCLRAIGLTELIHYSLTKPEGGSQVVLTNPLFTEYSALRTDLLSGLIDACQYNLEQGNGVLNGFEIGRVFWQSEDGLEEAGAVAGILGGAFRQGRWVWGGQEQACTWFEAKGLLDSIWQRLGLQIEYQPSRQDGRFHPGRTASLWLQGDRLGLFGQLHPQLRQEQGFPEAVYAFEFSLDVLLTHLDQDALVIPHFQPFSTYPASDRDIAFFAPKTVSVAELQRVITTAGSPLLDAVELFDEYRGEHVPDGQRSLAFRLIYRASDRTLTDTEIEPVHQHVRDALIEKFGVTLRS